MAPLHRLGVVASLALLASAGQIPIVDGVFGGVPTPTTPFEASRTVEDVAQVSGSPVPGKLRFITNSGVCGKHSNSMKLYGVNFCVTFRDDKGRVSSLRIC